MRQWICPLLMLDSNPLFRLISIKGNTKNQSSHESVREKKRKISRRKKTSDKSKSWGTFNYMYYLYVQNIAKSEQINYLSSRLSLTL